jgi:hypothetical protein
MSPILSVRLLVDHVTLADFSARNGEIVVDRGVTEGLAVVERDVEEPLSSLGGIE